MRQSASFQYLSLVLPCGLDSVQVIEKDGERGRNRTFNLLIKSQLLCQLSYAPSVGISREERTKNYSICSRSPSPRLTKLPREVFRQTTSQARGLPCRPQSGSMVLKSMLK